MYATGCSFLSTRDFIFILYEWESILRIYKYMSVNEATRNGCQSAWEEWLVLFARYLFNFFHDSRLHVLAELRETLPSLPKQTKRVSVYVCACVCRATHFCAVAHQSACPSVIQRMLFAFDRCARHGYGFLLILFHSVRLSQRTSQHASHLCLSFLCHHLITEFPCDWGLVNVPVRNG